MHYARRMDFLRPQRSRTGWLLACLLVPFIAFAARPTPHATSSSLLPAAFRDTIERGIANKAYHTLAVGLIDGKQHETLYFGHRDGVDSKPATDNDLFEIGALSEIFTGLLFAQGAIEGKLRFSDPIERWLPAAFPFASTRAGKISLRELATHRSGLPAQLPNLFPTDPNDPYAGYAAEDLLALLALDRSIRPQEKAEYDYSVLDAGLLGHLLGRVYRQPLAEVLAREVFTPLGLKHLTFSDDSALLTGYAHGIPAPHWHFGVLAGAAGLRANLPDLLALLQRQLTPEASPLRAALLLTRQAQADGTADRIGFGWNVRDSSNATATWPLVWRASRTAGFANFIGFRTDQQRAIVLLSNTTEDVAALGIAWLAGDAPPSAPHGSSPSTHIDLGQYSGLYRLTADVDAIVRVDDDSLSLQMSGRFPVRLKAVDHDVFVADDSSIGVSFIRAIDVVSGLMLRIGDHNVTASRLSTRAPRLVRQPVSAGPAQPSLPSDWRLDDATWLRLIDSPRGLRVQWTLGEPRDLFAYARDRYADKEGSIDLQVKRDARGRPSSLILDLAGAPREAVPLRSASTRTSP